MDIFTNTFADFTTAQLYFATIVILIASIIRGLTGFGFSAILVTALSLVFLPKEIVVLALILEIVASIHMLPSVRKHIHWPLLLSLLLGIAITTPIGMYLLNWVNPNLMRIAISLTVFIFAILIFKGFTYKGKGNFFLYTLIGAFSGLCNGAAALGGLPIVTFMLSSKNSVEKIRATLIATFFATDIYALIFANEHGILNHKAIAHSAYALPLLILGLTIGKKLFTLASPATFRTIALLLLISISAISLIHSLSQYI